MRLLGGPIYWRYVSTVLPLQRPKNRLSTSSLRPTKINKRLQIKQQRFSYLFIYWSHQQWHTYGEQRKILESVWLITKKALEKETKRERGREKKRRKKGKILGNCETEHSLNRGWRSVGKAASEALAKHDIGKRISASHHYLTKQLQIGRTCGLN